MALSLVVADGNLIISLWNGNGSSLQSDEWSSHTCTVLYCTSTVPKWLNLVLVVLPKIFGKTVYFQVDCFPAKAKGFVRRFWQSSVDHRGTVAYPGRFDLIIRDGSLFLSPSRVATLLRCKDLPEVSGVAHPEEGVWGMAYVLKEDGLEKTMEVMIMLLRLIWRYLMLHTVLYEICGKNGMERNGSFCSCSLYVNHHSAPMCKFITDTQVVASISNVVLRLLSCRIIGIYPPEFWLHAIVPILNLIMINLWIPFSRCWISARRTVTLGPSRHYTMPMTIRSVIELYMSIRIVYLRRMFSVLRLGEYFWKSDVHWRWDDRVDREASSECSWT